MDKAKPNTENLQSFLNSLIGEYVMNGIPPESMFSAEDFICEICDLLEYIEGRKIRDIITENLEWIEVIKSKVKIRNEFLRHFEVKTIYMTPNRDEDEKA